MINSMGQIISVARMTSDSHCCFRIAKFQINGEQDMEFGDKGSLEFTSSGEGKSTTQVLGDKDSFFIAYSANSCPSVSESHIDVLVHHIDSYGKILATIEVPCEFNFDFEVSDLNEETLELQYYEKYNRLVLVAMLKDYSFEKVDYSVAMINIDTESGQLALVQ